jgi:hypothetical protein
MYFLMRSGILKVDRTLFAIILFVPVWGVLCAFAVHYMNTSGRSGNKQQDLEAMRSHLVKQDVLAGRTEESVNVVPLEDALIVDDPSIRRSVMLDVLMSDADQYVPVLDQARMNDDVEVVHYATTAMAELSKEYELKIQELSSEYAKNPKKEGLLDEYISVLEQYLGTSFAQGQLYEIQRNTYQQLLITRIRRSPGREDSCQLVRSYLEGHQYPEADELLEQIEKKWPQDDEIWKERMRYYFETDAAVKMQEMIAKRKTDGRYQTREIRDLIRFWDESQGQA